MSTSVATNHAAPFSRYETAASDASESRRRIPELDGVRAIAIWMVFVTHGVFGFANAPGALDHVPGPLLLGVRAGWLGVDLFFLLSGFLITGILVDAKDAPKYFRNFYTRRALRIMPLYFACILVWSFFYTNARSYFLLSAVFGANLSYLVGVPEPKGPDVLWSLAVEEHFYLLWPIVVLVTSRRVLFALSAAIFVVTPCLRGWAAAAGMDPGIIYLLSWFRFDGLAGGAMLALWVRSPASSPRFANRLAVALLLFDVLLSAIMYKFGLSGSRIPAVALRYTQAYLLFGAFFVFVVAHAGSRWTAPLRWRVLQISGALSYCVYLVHFTVGVGYEAVVARSGWSPAASLGPSGALAARLCAMAIVSFGIAAFSRRYFDGPILALKDRLAPVADRSPAGSLG
ncbi:MAG TPA: acyltransferase [Gemmatimonadaceae bacterium]|jgi:peptidoglycan/LPS O-acetylase OafA/YrhL|nr:acyltransferase [Gemmatimonadaceae bacterium]